MFTANALTEDEYLALPWRPYLHLPTPVDLAIMEKPAKINTVGPAMANLQLRPGDVVAKSNLMKTTWQLSFYEASVLYAPLGLTCSDCVRNFMEHDNFCSNCGRPLK